VECETRERYEREKNATDELWLKYGAISSEGKTLMAASAELRNIIDAHRKDRPICRQEFRP